MGRVLAAALLLLLAACGPADEKSVDLVAPEEPLIWPQPPEKGRVQFLYAFREAKDLGFQTPFFERMWDWFAGEVPQGMVRPYAISTDGQLLAVADPGMRAIHLFDMNAQEYDRITHAGEDALLSPVGVAIAPDRMYVADSASGKVFGFDRDRVHILTIESLKRPTGLAHDQESKRLYVADTLSHRIFVFDEKGNNLFSFGERGNEQGEFNFPSHLFLKTGRLYVNDTMNFRLQTFDLEGNLLSSFGTHGDGSGNFAQPKGVAVDQEGNLYVVDALFNRVQIFDSQGHFLLAFGEQGSRVGSFWLPSGLFIDEDRIYVADSYNRRIQVFQFLGGG